MTKKRLSAQPASVPLSPFPPVPQPTKSRQRQSVPGASADDNRQLPCAAGATQSIRVIGCGNVYDLTDHQQSLKFSAMQSSKKLHVAKTVERLAQNFPTCNMLFFSTSPNSLGKYYIASGGPVLSGPDGELVLSMLKQVCHMTPISNILLDVMATSPVGLPVRLPASFRGFLESKGMYNAAMDEEWFRYATAFRHVTKSADASGAGPSSTSNKRAREEDESVGAASTSFGSPLTRLPDFSACNDLEALFERFDWSTIGGCKQLQVKHKEDWQLFLARAVQLSPTEDVAFQAIIDKCASLNKPPLTRSRLGKDLPGAMKANKRTEGYRTAVGLFLGGLTPFHPEAAASAVSAVTLSQNAEPSITATVPPVPRAGSLALGAPTPSALTPPYRPTPISPYAHIAEPNTAARAMAVIRSALASALAPTASVVTLIDYTEPSSTAAPLPVPLSVSLALGAPATSAADLNTATELNATATATALPAPQSGSPALRDPTASALTLAQNAEPYTIAIAMAVIQSALASALAPTASAVPLNTTTGLNSTATALYVPQAAYGAPGGTTAVTLAHNADLYTTATAMTDPQFASVAAAAASQAVAGAGHATKTMAGAGHPSNAIPGPAHVSQTMARAGHPSHAMPRLGHASETMPESAHLSQTMPGAGHPSLAIPGAAHTSETMPESGHPSETMPESGHASETMSGAGHASETMSGAGHPSQTIPGAGHPSETMPGSGNLSIVPSTENLTAGLSSTHDGYILPDALLASNCAHGLTQSRGTCPYPGAVLTSALDPGKGAGIDWGAPTSSQAGLGAAGGSSPAAEVNLGSGVRDGLEAAATGLAPQVQGLASEVVPGLAPEGVPGLAPEVVGLAPAGLEPAAPALAPAGQGVATSGVAPAGLAPVDLGVASAGLGVAPAGLGLSPAGLAPASAGLGVAPAGLALAAPAIALALEGQGEEPAGPGVAPSGFAPAPADPALALEGRGEEPAGPDVW